MTTRKYKVVFTKGTNKVEPLISHEYIAPGRCHPLHRSYIKHKRTLSTHFNPSITTTSYQLTLYPINPLYQHYILSPGRYTIELPLHPPESFLLVIGMTNEHGQYYEDTVPVRLLNILPDTLPPLLV